MIKNGYTYLNNKKMEKKSILITLLIVLFMISVNVQAQHQQDKYRFDPPWNTPPKSSVEFTIHGIENVPDLYGDITNPDLTIFLSGNQFMVVDDLLDGFKKKHPEIERIFVETLPPGVLAEQIEGGSLTIGNLRITNKPDIYTAENVRITTMKDRFSRTEAYAYNDLSLMVQKNNPKKIKGLESLGQELISISMPDPQWSGVGKQIEKAYKKAGGENLYDVIMNKKTKEGSTYLSHLHHRESPLRILNGESDAAPVWSSEIVYQKMIGNPVDGIDIPKSQNVRSTYVAGQLKNAPHSDNATLFMNYLISDEAKAIYKKYGFETNE
jgi:molybdate transport system substrate-binding protein